MAVGDATPALDVSQHKTVVLDDGSHEVIRLENNNKISSLTLCIAIMMLSGALVDFLGKSLYNLVPREASGAKDLPTQWLAFFLTFGGFIACAIPPTLQKKNRQAFWENMNPKFAARVCAPSFLDLAITGLRFISLMYISPSMVAILKNSVQLATLAVINSLRGKRLTCKQWASLAGTIAGDCIVSEASVVRGHQTDATASNAQVVGIGFVVFSGVLGACRNSAEEVIMQRFSFPDGALLMIESWFSGILALVAGAVCAVMTSGEGLEETWSVLCAPAGAVFFALFLLTAYGRDSGKLKVTKYASALVAKVLALLFPFGTWIISLAAFYVSKNSAFTGNVVLGEAWSYPASWGRLAGFVVITGSCGLFIHKK